MLLTGLSLTGLSWAGLAGCGRDPSRPSALPSAPPLTPSPGQRVVEHTLTPRATRLDLGGVEVDTWAYGDALPGPLIRANAGDLIRVRVDSELPEETTVHWHGIALRNVADGIPHTTQDPIPAGGSYLYEYVAPDPGTYFYHSHVGLQLDRGLYAPLIIDDPAEPGDYDAEWIVVLDDWVDGTGRTPEDVLAELTAGSGDGHHHDHGSMGDGSMGDMGEMDMSGMGGNAKPPPYGHSDVTYPHFLINGRIPADAETFRARPGQRIRIRVINASADTVFSIALPEHTMTVTHSDGFPVQPTEARALYLGMGERYDVLVTVGDGVFPLVATPFGKEGRALAWLRSGSGEAIEPTALPAAYTRNILEGADLLPAESALLPKRPADDQQSMMLSGSMSPYTWAINGAPHGLNQALEVTEGQRVRFGIMNHTTMAHPMHVHGHTFALDSGLRKDTVLVKPMSMLNIELQADNPGLWMAHCHNAYHGEAGMMIDLDYRV